ncbi:MAG: T9SS type A sorting domain-containing protein [Candidatus Marinimicrobia bacterium]|nr:T9SS type A sorting domain-containing protein [Candidatus Neomarinimicrobiota bacterium]
MKNLLRISLVLVISTSLALALIPRVATIPVPEVEVNNGGVGNMIAGEDVDGDGAVELYLVNDNSGDTDVGELVPRIYKMERAVGDTAYSVVWKANAQDFAPDITQNTWPTLSLADLDNDEKMELVWGIVNAGSGNPFRIWVYEHAGGDNFGIQHPTTGKWEPNSVWTIAEEDGLNIRPISWEITDIDDDSVDEIIFASRKSDLTFGVASVDNIPDAGDGSETWTLEFSQSDLLNYGGDNKWDVAVIGSNAYLFDEVVISKVSWDGSEYAYSEMSPLPGGITFDASEVCDVDGDSVEEIITGEYTYGDGSDHIWLLQEDGDTLARYPLFDISTEEYLNGGYLAGGDQGDIDNDGNVDFIFGSRYSGLPNAIMFRVEYLGSGDVTEPSSWELTIADSAAFEYASAVDGLWNVIQVANIDEDPEDEVLYTSSYAAQTYPIAVLDVNEYTTAVRNAFEPRSFELGEAYPNPFNPSTVIPFTLEATGNVSLTVFNTRGENVATLIANEHMEAGQHHVMFNGSDLASGVYFYQLRVDNTFRAGKVVLTK